MATVTAYTAARSLQIENSSVTSGTVDANGNLILTTRGGTPINAGYVVGPAGTPVGSIEQTVKNSSGVAIAKGNVVYISGALDGTALIAKAQANSDATSSKVLGLASEAINNGATGKVMTEGILTGLDTSAATDGDTVWLSATVPGGFVYGNANRPLAPNHSVYVGKVLEAHATLGSIYIRIDNGDQINELHDVTVSSPAATHVLARNSENTLWQNRALAAADIPSLDAAKITSGTLAAARIPNLDASKITSGIISEARLPVATESNKGIVEQATQAQVNLGVDEALYITPAELRDSINLPWSTAAGTGTSSGSGLVTVTFPSGRFSVAPRVTCQQQQQTGGVVGVSYVQAVTSTNFQFGLFTLAGGYINAGTINWVAVQMSSSNASG